MATKKSSALKQPQQPDPNRVFIGGMPTTLGMRLVSLTKKKVVAEMPIKDQHRNWNGRVNGGAIMSLADATGAAGAVANMPPHHRGGTLESKTIFLPPAWDPCFARLQSRCTSGAPPRYGRPPSPTVATASAWQS